MTAGKGGCFPEYVTTAIGPSLRLPRAFRRQGVSSVLNVLVSPFCPGIPSFGETAVDELRFVCHLGRVWRVFTSDRTMQLFFDVMSVYERIVMSSCWLETAYEISRV